MHNRPTHKRTATAASTSSLPTQTTKKTRFLDPSEDPVNFSEEVDATLENPSAKRKGRVKTQGYESDSSDDGQGVVYSRRKDKDKQADRQEENDDMFAVAEKEDLEDEEGTKKKEVYLRLGDIEGQEFNDASDGESEFDDGDEPEDEDDAARRKKATMGYEISSFNMREEMEEGRFAADGTYIKTFDPHSVHDRWMDGVSEKDMKLAKRCKKQRDRVQIEKMKAEDREIEQSGGKAALELQLVELLKRGETVLEALTRLGNVRNKKVHPSKNPSNGSSEKGTGMVVDKRPSEGLSLIDRITHLASNLMALGDVDIYSKTYEELVRSIRSSTKMSPDWIPPSADVKYEYKWNTPDQRSGDAFGPFDDVEMRDWYQAAYFGDFGEEIKVRRIGGEWGDWEEVFESSSL